MGSGLVAPGQPGPLGAGEFVSASQPNIVSFNTKNVAPPSPLYVQRDDVLFLSVFSTIANETVTIGGRLLRADGTIVPFDAAFKVPTAFVVNNFTLTLAEGFLLSVTAIATISTERGQTYVRAFLQRSSGANAYAATPLFADYTTLTINAGWPVGRVISPTEGPGLIVTQTPANPAAGTDWSISANTNSRLNLLYAAATLTTSGTVGNRNVTIGVKDVGSGKFAWTGSPTASIPASTTATVSFQPGSLPSTVIATNISVGMPSRVIVDSQTATTINVVTQGIQVGDQWSNIAIIFEQWFST